MSGPKYYLEVYLDGLFPVLDGQNRMISMTETKHTFDTTRFSEPGFFRIFRKENNPRNKPKITHFDLGKNNAAATFLSRMLYEATKRWGSRSLSGSSSLCL